MGESFTNELSLSPDSATILLTLCPVVCLEVMDIGNVFHLGNTAPQIFIGDPICHRGSHDIPDLLINIFCHVHHDDHVDVEGDIDVYIDVNVDDNDENVEGDGDDIDVNPIQGGGGPNQPPLSRICVYACGYAYTGANFL